KNRRRHTRSRCAWSSDVCPSDLYGGIGTFGTGTPPEATTGPGGGGGPKDKFPRFGPLSAFVLPRYAITAVISASERCDSGRIVPVPPVTIARIASSPMRAVTSDRLGATPSDAFG